MLLEVKIGEQFELVGGMRVTRLNLSNQLIDASNKDTGAWRKLVGDSGVKSLSILASGVFTNNMAENYIAKSAFNSSIETYRLNSESGDVIEGQFYLLSCRSLDLI